MIEDNDYKISRLSRYKEIAINLFNFDTKILPQLKKCNVKTVVIYGMGNIGRFLADKFTSLGISVYCGIDKKNTSYKKYKILSLQEFNQLEVSVDMIVVTPFYDYEKIKQNFVFKYQCYCLSIEDLCSEIKKIGTYKTTKNIKKHNLKKIPKISVIMPIYNSEKFIEQTINCILTQSFADFELLIINDHPKDSTMEIARGFKDSRIRIIDNEKNMGISFSRNRGLSEARGEYIALMDHDDLCSNQRFEIEVNYLDSNPDIDVIGTAYSAIDENGKTLWTKNKECVTPMQNKAELMFYDTVANSSTMFRKSFVMNNNLRYKDNCLGMEDYMFWVEASAYGKIANLNDVLYSWRCLETNETNNVFAKKMSERKLKFAEIQKKALEINGVILTPKELEIYNNFFSEDLSKKENFETLQKIYPILQKIILQTLGKENSNEIKNACKRLYFEKIHNSLFC